MQQIKDFEIYMLTEENINKNYCNFLNKSSININKNYKKDNDKKRDNNNKTNNININNNRNNNRNNSRNCSIYSDNKEYYIPYSEDKLFWCFYKIINDLWDENETFKLEKEFKISCIEKLRKIKNDLKPYKLTVTHIENDLLNEKKISLKTLIALSILYKINLIYTKNYTYYEINNNSLDDNSETFLINNINNSECLVLVKKDLDYYRNNYFCIENINKPLKAISGYTIKELELIAKKLQINIDNIKIKKDIYQKIVEKF